MRIHNVAAFIVLSILLAGCGHGLSGVYSLPDDPGVKIVFSYNGTYTTDVYGDKRSGTYKLYQDNHTVSLIPGSLYDMPLGNAIKSLFTSDHKYEGIAKDIFDHPGAIQLEEDDKSFDLKTLHFVKE